MKLSCQQVSEKLHMLSFLPAQVAEWRKYKWETTTCDRFFFPLQFWSQQDCTSPNYIPPAQSSGEATKKQNITALNSFTNNLNKKKKKKKS